MAVSTTSRSSAGLRPTVAYTVSTATRACRATSATVVARYPLLTNRSRAASRTARRVATACSRRRGEWYRRAPPPWSATCSVIRLDLSVRRSADPRDPPGHSHVRGRRRGRGGWSCGSGCGRDRRPDDPEAVPGTELVPARDVLTADAAVRQPSLAGGHPQLVVEIHERSGQGDREEPDGG